MPAVRGVRSCAALGCVRWGEYFVLLTRASGHVAADKGESEISADSSLVFIYTTLCIIAKNAQVIYVSTSITKFRL